MWKNTEVCTLTACFERLARRTVSASAELCVGCAVYCVLMERHQTEHVVYVREYFRRSFVIFFTGAENMTPASEADTNWHCDPEAAHAVLAGLNTVITLLPFEICLQSSLSWVCSI